VTAIALAKGAAASGSTLTIIKGALKLMAWTKAKTAVVIGVGILLATGTTIITIQEIQNHWRYSWEVPKYDGVNNQIIWNTPPQVRIVPTKFSKLVGNDCYGADNFDDAQAMGICVPLREIIEDAYISYPPRIVLPASLPAGNYDFISNLPKGSAKALREEIKRKFGLNGQKEWRDTGVLVLKLADTDTWGFKPTDNSKSGTNIDTNFRTLDTKSGTAKNIIYTMHWSNATLGQSRIIDSLESQFQLPIIDETGLTNRYDFSVTWPVQRSSDNDAYNQAIKDALLNQLGLELVPATRTIEMLVVEKAK
jgi:uncharacterized protein (TIGR03435 family)